MKEASSEKLQSMTVTEHLLELRKRILLIVIGIVICTAALAPFMQLLFNYLSKPLLSALPQGTQLLSVSVIAPVMGPLKVLLFSAFCISFPFTLLQIWEFFSPGLYKHEKKVVIPFIISSVFMFILGVAYCYFIVFGFLFKFIASFSPESISFAPDIDSYISFVLHMFLAFGITFEVPVAVILLSALNVVTPTKLKKFRRYLIVIAFLIAAVLTPPDVTSQLMLALPIIILYEIGVVFSYVLFRKRENEKLAAQSAE